MTPTPHQPDSSIDIEALRKAAEADRSISANFVMAASPEIILALLDERRALLDRLERADAELASVPPFSRAALLEFNAKYCLNKPDLVACAESAFYWFNKCHAVKGAAAGAVPEGKIQRIMREADEIIAAAPPSQGLPAPSHETIITEGDTLVCTACGTTAPAAAPSEPVAWRWKWDDDQDEPWRYSPSQPCDSGKLGVVMDALYLATPPAQDAGTAGKDSALATARECLSTLNAIGEYAKAEKIIETSMRGIAAIDRAIANSGRAG